MSRADAAGVLSPDARAGATGAWHALTIADVVAALDTDRTGLPEVEAAERLARFGPNRLDPPAPVSALQILRDQLRTVVVFLLIAAAIVSLLLGDHIEAGAIGLVLVINTSLGFVTELRARRAMESLLQLDAARAAVMRDARLHAISADKLVPGDVIQIDAGQRIPADARLIDTTELRTGEAALTGESLPVSKHAIEPLPAETALADRVNMVYKATMVVAGTGRAVVTATGPATEVGHIGRLVSAIKDEPTPLERRLDALGHRLVWLALSVAALVAALGAWQGVPLGLVIETGIALAVAAVPEALPAVATIALAVGLRRMARRHALVRRLPAVESLGSTTVICTDKTRTLTSGEMTVVRVWTAYQQYALDPDAGSSDAFVRRVLETGALASRPPLHGEPAGGDPVDLAIIDAARRSGLDHAELVRDRVQVGLVPFSSERKLMASFHRKGEGLVACVKGAPQRIVALSGAVMMPDGPRPLDAAGREALLAVNDALARDGLRVLAVATGSVSTASEAALSGLTLVGFVGLMDPPARGVRETIARLREAGLRTLMVTGDQRVTAAAVGRQLGLLHDVDAVCDGRELEGCTAAELDAMLVRAAAFSRITPEHKLKIVSGLQARGDIVAMLGDGINDAAALRKADVGVAMGVRGTDLAKEAAAIVLLDDRFETIAAAVEEGRVIFDNIRKFVFYLFSCNVAEVMLLLAAGLAGLPPPLLPLQILWLNMVTDTFPALALAMEPGDPDVMARPPRDPEEAILSRAFIARVLFYGVLITAATLWAYVSALETGAAHAQTMAFMTLALAQVFHLGTARSDVHVLSPPRIVSNPYAVGAVVLSVALQIAAVGVGPIAHVLRVAPLGAGDWLVAVALAVGPAIVGQAIRVRGRAA